MLWCGDMTEIVTDEGKLRLGHGDRLILPPTGVGGRLRLRISAPGPSAYGLRAGGRFVRLSGPWFLSGTNEGRVYARWLPAAHPDRDRVGGRLGVIRYAPGGRGWRMPRRGCRWRG
ncbi:hypothetical protein GCM10022251_65610 [Phytohabitans flavus]